MRQYRNYILGQHPHLLIAVSPIPERFRHRVDVVISAVINLMNEIHGSARLAHDMGATFTAPVSFHSLSEVWRIMKPI